MKKPRLVIVTLELETEVTLANLRWKLGRGKDLFRVLGRRALIRQMQGNVIRDTK